MCKKYLVIVQCPSCRLALCPFCVPPSAVVSKENKQYFVCPQCKTERPFVEVMTTIWHRRCDLCKRRILYGRLLFHVQKCVAREQYCHSCPLVKKGKVEPHACEHRCGPIIVCKRDTCVVKVREKSVITGRLRIMRIKCSRCGTVLSTI